ncbi:F-box/kelch-repeat protein At3g06240 [Lactuca sativa]|uniref:F-box/kelch-repeat protein At3g06240 n=1 Tax=Lactuca sativa TaxID=4236 RepID=UPI000CD96217|nr:F-box/kelch-repeat protein At3g06240 [Lactuca sativa]
MASPQHQMTTEMLPDELLLNIFIRLSAKQLAQMRSVSKSWNSLLSQSSFVKSHLHRSSHNNDQILLVFCPTLCSSDSKLFKAHLRRSPHLELTEFNTFFPVNLESGHTTRIKVIGAVNGLICSFYYLPVLHIWNPSLSAMSTLPPYSTPSCLPFEICFRFGFDPKTNDYKVVKLTSIANYIGTSPYILREWMQVEVYSMRKGSWELIAERFPSHMTMVDDLCDVCADGHDGHLHWHCHCMRGTDTDTPATIVAFDMGSETFHEMPLPDSILEYKSCYVLGVLATKLCVMTWDENDAFEVWVMNEYGVAESWSKRHAFSQFDGFTSHGEFLVEDRDERLVLYDPVANKAKVLDNYCLGDIYLEKIVEYVDSLVWVAPSEHEIVDGAGQNERCQV